MAFGCFSHVLSGLLLEIRNTSHRAGSRTRLQERQPMVSQVRGGCWNKNNCPLLRRSWALLVGCKVNVGVKRPAIGLAGLARPEKSVAFLDGLCCYPAGDDDGLDGLDWVGPEIVRARDMGLLTAGPGWDGSPITFFPQLFFASVRKTAFLTVWSLLSTWLLFDSRRKIMMRLFCCCNGAQFFCSLFHHVDSDKERPFMCV